MKKLALTFLLVIIAILIVAQIPQGFKYQTVVRGSTGEILPNQNIGLQINIREGSSSGTIVYQEIHYLITNQFGLAILNIGTESPLIGSFPSIDWQSGLKFLEVELDPTGSSGFTSMGTTQLLSVPFALHAETSSQDGDWTIDGIDLYTTVSGNVGIGTSTPGNGKLDVIGDGNTGIFTSSIGSNALHAESNAGGNFAAGYFNSTNPGTYGIWTQSSDYEALYANTLSTTFPAIRANGEFAGIFEGKVGIGTNNPVSQLQVNGDDGVIFSGIFGSGTIPVEGSGTRLMWYPGKGALRVGYVDGIWWDDSYIGDHSMAFGFNTIASGLRSTAMGSWTTASGETSTAMGSGSIASATDAVAMGFHAEASGNQSIAMGSNPGASGHAAVSIGAATEATGDYATAMGYGSIAQAYRSFVVGSRNIASGTTDSWVDTDPIFVIGNGLYPAFSNAMTVLKNGNIGIGTTNPIVVLDVNGNINSKNNYLIDGSSIISVEGTGNLMVGKGAGGNINASHVTLLGDSAGYNNQGSFNLFGGTNAGYANTMGYHNTFLGSDAGYSNTDGLENSFIGTSSGISNTLGSFNTYLGCFAGLSNTSGMGNTFIGNSSGGSNITGRGNTYIGTYSGVNNVGDSNIFIGYNAGYYETALSSKLIIANGYLEDNILIYGDFVSGNLGIGTKTLNHKLNINGNAVLNGEDGWDDPGDQANLFLGDPNHGMMASHSEGLRIYTYNNPSHDIRFQDHTGIDYMTIQMGTGNVGIGTSLPSAGKLEVIGGSFTAIDASSDGSNTIHATSSAGGGYAAGYFNAINPGTYGIVAQSSDYDGLYVESSASSHAAIRAVGSSGAYAGLFDGFVGIGTTNPVRKLHISDGFIRIDPGYALEMYHDNGYQTIIGSSIGSNDTYYINTAGGGMNFSTGTSVGFTHSRLFIQNDGTIGIGTTNPSMPLHINQELISQGIRLEYSGTSYWDTYVDGAQDYNFAYNGVLKSYILDTDGSYVVVSDKNLKTDITPLPKVIDKVKQLQPCTYRFKDDNSGGNKSIGLIAQEVEPLFPEVVHEKDGLKGINYDTFAVIAIQAIKEQQAIIEDLRSRLEKLEND